MSFSDTYYQDKSERCRVCGRQAKDLFMNAPYCRSCIKQVENNYENV